MNFHKIRKIFVSSGALNDSFDPKAFYGVGECGLNGLKTYGEECDKEGKTACCEEYGPMDGDAIGEIL